MQTWLTWCATKTAKQQSLCCRNCVTSRGDCKGQGTYCERSRRSKSLVKQECVIADANGGCKVILWEDNVELLEKGQTYKMSGMMVRIMEESIFLFQKITT